MKNIVNNVFNKNKIRLIHPIYLINNKSYNDIIENPNFDNSKIEIINNNICFKENTFTGLRGTLALKHTHYIMNHENKQEILQFLSIFSGRLFELRNIFLFKYLPLQNGYVDNFLKNFCGFNYIDSIPLRYFLSKNKNIFNLKLGLIYLLNNKENLAKSIHITKFFCSLLDNINVMPQSKKLNSFFLGKNIYSSSLLIEIYLINYNAFIKSFDDQTNIKFFISNFIEIFKIKFYIPKIKILLKNYRISNQVFFIN